MRVVGIVREMTVTQAQLGKALGLSAARINQLIDEGIVVRDEQATNGQVMLYESLQNYFLSKNVTGDNVNFWKERGLHEKAKRELAEVKLSKTRGELYEAAVVESVLTEILTNFRNKLLGMPSKYASILEGKTRDEIFNVLNSALEEELLELSENTKAATFDETSADIEEDSALGSETDT